MKLVQWALRLAGIACVAFVAQSVTSLPLSAESAVVSEREAAMKAVGGQMRVFAPIAKGDQPFDGEKVKAAAEIVLANLTRAETLFPEGSTGGRALPAVWEKPTEFNHGFAKAKEAAAGLVEVGTADAADGFAAAFKALGSTCGACHETYRGPEN